MPQIKLGDFGGRVAPLPQPGGAGLTQAAFVTPDGGLSRALVDTASEMVEQETRARRAAELQDNIGKATQELGDLELKLSADQDYKTSPQRFTQEAQKIRERYTDGIGDAVVKSAFGSEMQKIEFSKSLTVKKAAFKRETDYNQASLDSTLDVLAHQAAATGSDQERLVYDRQAAIAIAAMQTGGWLSAEDAGQKQRRYLGRLDDVRVRREIAANPAATADRLALDPNFVPNLDPVARERWTDTAYKRADTEGRRLAAEEEKRAKARADELMKESEARLADGRLTREYIEEVRPFIGHGDYRRLLEASTKKGAAEDNRTAFAEVQGLLYSNPGAAPARALQLHKLGQLTDATLASVMGRARDLSRTDGPKSPYERHRAFITNAIKPSEMVPDPAASARFALALREYDDYAGGEKRTEADLRTRAEEIVKHHSMVNMVELAQRTAAGGQPTPGEQLKALDLQEDQLAADYAAKKITRQEFNRKSQTINAARAAAQKASLNNAGK